MGLRQPHSSLCRTINSCPKMTSWSPGGNTAPLCAWNVFLHFLFTDVLLWWQQCWPWNVTFGLHNPTTISILRAVPLTRPILCCGLPPLENKTSFSTDLFVMNKWMNECFIFMLMSLVATEMLDIKWKLFVSHLMRSVSNPKVLDT